MRMRKSLLNNLVPVLYEDGALLAVNKPAGVDVGQMPGESRVGLVDLIIQERGPDEPLHVTNRLSRYESGVLLLAKKPVMARHVRTGLKTGHIVQEYLAVLSGEMKNRRVWIETTPQPARDQTSRSRDRRALTEREASEAATTVQRLEAGNGNTLIACRTRAETTHALKAQLRCAGLRLLGDPRGISPKAQVPLAETCLHLGRISFHHPELQRRMTITAPRPPALKRGLASFAGADRFLAAGLAGRLPLRNDPDTDAYRLLTGSVEGLPGMVAERFGDVLILLAEEDKTTKQQLRRAAHWYRKTLGLRAVYDKPLVQHGSRHDEALLRRARSPEPLIGEKVQPEIIVRENGVKFAIRPYDGFAVGLYLDQRDNRAGVRSMAQGKDFLNLFAYTCGFSVAAALGGARSTTSVDISVKSLEWGKRNFALNGLDLEGHWFIRSDALGYFRRAQRQGKTFDLIIVDAPSFARGRRKGESFSIKEDLAALIGAACEILRPNGQMMVSINHRRLSHRWLQQQVREGGRARKPHIIATPPLPIDFALDKDHAKTVFAQFS
jgi:23S rRNA (cytosine1962-C5)-methyltransferase